MSKRAPTIIAEHESFGSRAVYNSERQTIVSDIDTDAPCAAAVTQAGKLRALTVLMNGEGFDVFDSLADPLKRDLIWLLNDLADDVYVLAQLASDLYCMPRKTEAEANHG